VCGLTPHTIRWITVQNCQGSNSFGSLSELNSNRWFVRSLIEHRFTPLT